MGARSGGGGGSRGGGGVQQRLAARYAAMSPQERYKATQDLANEIQRLANKDRKFVQGGSNGDWEATDLNKYLSAVEAKGGFAGDVAKSVKSTVRYGMGYGTVAKMSSKQAWVLAKAGVEHAIPTWGNTHKIETYKVKYTTSSGKTKSKKISNVIEL